MRYTKLALLVLALSLGAVDVPPQTAVASASAAQNVIDLDELIARFFSSSEEYEKTFLNLVAEETKIIEAYRASGKVEKRREIVSDLVVYHSARDGRDATTEYRDVRSVDGRAVDKRSERAVKLLTNAAKADSLTTELEAINRETERYEFRRHLRNFTIHQVALPKQWREAGQVEWRGHEQIAGRDVVVLEYREMPRPGMKLTVPKEFGRPSFSCRGRLWLDARTGQLWRDVAEVVVPHPAAAEPLVMLRRESIYGPSRFGILVPERIVWDWVTHFSHPRNGQPSFTLSERTTFTYSAFRRFDVATEERMKMPDARER